MGIVFEEIECRSSLHRVRAANVPFRWALDPYRTAAPPCGFCGGAVEGDSRVIVKVNAAEALRREIGRPGWRRETVAIGTACEPYHAAELRYSLTHRVLKVLRDQANPATLFTRSALVARDAGLLVELGAATDISVVFPLATLDGELRRRIEPASDPVERRLRAMEHLAAAGVRCGVLLAPVAPGLTDGPAGLERVVEAASAQGATFLHPNLWYLRPGTREWSTPLLREAYPHITDRFAAYYRGPHGARTFTRDVHRMVDELRERFGLPMAPEAGRAVGQLELAM